MTDEAQGVPEAPPAEAAGAPPATGAPEAPPATGAPEAPPATGAPEAPPAETPPAEAPEAKAAAPAAPPAAPPVETGAPQTEAPSESETTDAPKEKKASMVDNVKDRVSMSRIRASTNRASIGARMDHSRITSRISKDDHRKKSNYFSVGSIKRGSYASYMDRTKVPKFMNTYKLSSERPFNADRVRAIIVKVFNEEIEDDMVYNPETCPAKAKLTSLTIRNRVKDLDFERYKLVCLVTIGEKKSYDIFSGARFMWDAERDRYAMHRHENMYLFAVASVYGVYFE